jgi:hypothetical protein
MKTGILKGAIAEAVALKTVLGNSYSPQVPRASSEMKTVVARRPSLPVRSAMLSVLAVSSYVKGSARWGRR